MRKGLTEERQDRIEFLKVLAQLGLSYKEMAKIVGVTLTIVSGDMRLIGGVRPNFPDVPKGQQKKIVLVKEFCRLYFVHTKTVFEKKLYKFLIKSLGIKDLHSYLCGVINVMEHLRLPECTPEQQPYLELLKFVYGLPHAGETADYIWLLFLDNINNDVIRTSGDLQQDLCRFVAKRERGKITTSWPDIAIEEIEAVLPCLESRPAHVVRTYFGLGVEQQNLTEISQEFLVTRQQVRRYLSSAQRKLWCLLKKRKLDLLVSPINQHVEDVLTAHRVRRLMEGTSDLPIELLLTPVREIEMSIRSDHCLYNANIVFIGELIAKTEEELLKTKRFGRRSLKEIKELLRARNLSLGTPVSPDHLQHMVDIKRGLI